MMRVVFQDSLKQGGIDRERERENGGAYFTASSNISLLGPGWVTGAAVDTLF